MKNVILISVAIATLVGTIISCTHVQATGLDIPQAQELVIDEPEEPVWMQK